MSPIRLPFVKVEGLGNDFVLLDLRREQIPGGLEALAAAAPRWCDRRRGVGADGLLVVVSAHAPADARMIVLNADGSRPEMCGNGLRCVAAHVAGAWSWEGLPPPWREEAAVVTIETDAGPHRCVLATEGVHREDASAEVDVEMVAAALGETVELPEAPGRRFVTVSMGNPHAVCFVRDDEDPEVLARRLGPSVERASAFPNRTNVEFVRREAEDSFTTWVWERGCGITEACGTGACAVAAAAVAEGVATAGHPVRVRLPGGPLTITVPRDPDRGVGMRGPARRVFTGELLLPAPT